uniref:Macaca fascicularis brain cDNA clone: QorA-10159, similar to human adenosine A1 receptor (ADORA1), mRNA, RefSeq: NM_000674.1 n=1 Tax=Macaca fascicularis TaxID=9541 RepID=I7GJY6_MACFA|nr:unnamed protein product [Macaca fascicularis]
MSCRAVSTAQPSPTSARPGALLAWSIWALPLGPLPASRQDGACLVPLGARLLMCPACARHAALHLSLPGRLHRHRGAHRPGLCAWERAGDLGGEGEPYRLRLPHPEVPRHLP